MKLTKALIAQTQESDKTEPVLFFNMSMRKMEAGESTSQSCDKRRASGHHCAKLEE